MTSSISDIRTRLEAEARVLGFDGFGVADPDSIPHAEQDLNHYIELGHHGTMDWLATRASQRRNPKSLWPATRSVIMLAMNYGPETNPMDVLDQADSGAISVYARNRDYHDLIKKRLKALARFMIEHYGGELKVFVDTAPVMEKPLAQAAGLGWQGKHTNLVSREFGSWVFLGAIYTTLDLPFDAAAPDSCGSCHACLDICPTQAFPAPHQIDARRCISYLTIEHKGPIPLEFREKMGNRIYGCDDCLAVCPWNKFASTAREAKLIARDDLQAPKLADLVTLDDAAFRTFFSGSPIKRIGRNRFIRNVLIAIGNSGDRAFLPQVAELENDPDPVVTDAARWARERLHVTE